MVTTGRKAVRGRDGSVKRFLQADGRTGRQRHDCSAARLDFLRRLRGQASLTWNTSIRGRRWGSVFCQPASQPASEPDILIHKDTHTYIHTDRQTDRQTPGKLLISWTCTRETVLRAPLLLNGLTFPLYIPHDNPTTLTFPCQVRHPPSTSMIHMSDRSISE